MVGLDNIIQPIILRRFIANSLNSLRNIRQLDSSLSFMTIFSILLVATKSPFIYYSLFAESSRSNKFRLINLIGTRCKSICVLLYCNQHGGKLYQSCVEMLIER